VAGYLALDSLPPALYQGPSVSEEVKPVVTRLVVLGAAVGSLALLAGAVTLVLRLAQPTEYPVDLSREPDGEIVGRVAKVEPGVILLSSEPSGSGVVPLVVTKDTRVMVGTIEGWINDVRPGGQIKVAYDLYEGKRLARSVEVLVEQGARRPAPADPTPAAPPAATASTRKPATPAKPAPAPLPQPETPAPGPKAEAPRVAQPKAPTPAPATPPPAAPAPPTPAVVRPAPPAPAAPTPVAPAPAPPRPAPQTPTPPAPEPPVRTQEPARPQESDSTDGSAAVDWFLKGRR